MVNKSLQLGSRAFGIGYPMNQYKLDNKGQEIFQPSYSQNLAKNITQMRDAAGTAATTSLIMQNNNEFQNISAQISVLKSPTAGGNHNTSSMFNRHDKRARSINQQHLAFDGSSSQKFYKSKGGSPGVFMFDSATSRRHNGNTQNYF